MLNTFSQLDTYQGTVECANNSCCKHRAPEIKPSHYERRKNIERSFSKESKRTNFMRKKSQYICLCSLCANGNQIRVVSLNFLTSDKDYFITLLYLNPVHNFHVMLKAKFFLLRFWRFQSLHQLFVCLFFLTKLV